MDADLPHAGRQGACVVDPTVCSESRKGRQLQSEQGMGHEVHLTLQTAHDVHDKMILCYAIALV